VDAMRIHPGPVRLTRRGRRVVLTFLVLVVTFLGVMVAKTGRAADTTPLPVKVVQSGDTLWSIAGDCAPRRDRAATIEDIRELNGLEGYTVHAGQRLTLPRP
jgi:hypothetical protein